MEYFMYLFAAAAIVFPWYLISITIDRGPNRQEKALKKAIEQGHVVTAVFVRSYQKEKETGGSVITNMRSTEKHILALFSRIIRPEHWNCITFEIRKMPISQLRSMYRRRTGF